MTDIERESLACPIPRRVIRNVSKNAIRVSSEHRLALDQIHHAINLAESIVSMQNADEIFHAFSEHKKNGIGEFLALHRGISSLIVKEIQKIDGNYYPQDKVHKLISDAGASCANLTAFNCGMYDYIAGSEDSFDDYFTNDITDKAQPEILDGKSVVSTCIAPQLGKKWVQAATEAMLLYDPTITPKLTSHKDKN